MLRPWTPLGAENHKLQIKLKGTMLHGVINKARIKNLRSLIQEGNVYLIKNVRVIPAAAKFRPVQNEMMINFLPTTNIEEIEDSEDIPKHGFNFSGMEVLSQRVSIDTYLSGMISLNFLDTVCHIFSCHV